MKLKVIIIKLFVLEFKKYYLCNNKDYKSAIQIPL